MDFTGIQFNGTFRDYQQAVIDHASEYLKDGRVHIVAAPGSGKTILGLELIRRLGHPALVLAPTVTIRQQWGDRFRQSFLPAADDAGGLISYDLRKPALLTCVTYQGLHAAHQRLAAAQIRPEDGDDEQPDATPDFSTFDLIGCLKGHGVTTICLDEAHHLRTEWYKALTDTVAQLGTGISIIALTATPPYDSEPQEWQRYIGLCGPIDDEISVPQLVAAGILCPHQDYVYFNYPTASEQQLLRQHQQRVEATLAILRQSGYAGLALTACGVLPGFQTRQEMVLDSPEGFIALLTEAQGQGVAIPPGLVRLISPDGHLPEADLTWAQRAYQFIIDRDDLFGPALSQQVFMALAKSGLIDQRQVTLCSDAKVARLLAASVGKLDSICAIAADEALQLKDRLRMLVLTDFIRTDQLSLVGTDQPLLSLGTVPIFEALRRRCGNDASIGMLSGTMVILPTAVIPQAQAAAHDRGAELTARPLGATAHSLVEVGRSNQDKVAIITELFTKGAIDILVGTKALLGEGWDAPCINTLILASYVGSFMLSNQMRGRAIRIDKADPAKTADIWHLVTVDPTADGQPGQPSGDDYVTLRRRFEGFLGPSYDGTVIENGLRRLTAIKPPFDQAGIAAIDGRMLALSHDRPGMAAKWQGMVKDPAHHPEVMDVNETTGKVAATGFVFNNVLLGIVYVVLWALARGVVRSVGWLAGFTGLADAAVTLAVVIALGLAFWHILNFATPLATVRSMSQAILDTLRDLGEVTSPQARVEVRATELGTGVYSGLVEGTVHEKAVYAQAVGELLSPIDNPRYLLIGRLRFWFIDIRSSATSYACPDIIGTNKEGVSALARHLRSRGADVELVYTRSQEGRAKLLECRNRSYMNHNAIYAGRHQMVASRWR